MRCLGELGVRRDGRSWDQRRWLECFSGRYGITTGLVLPDEKYARMDAEIVHTQRGEIFFEVEIEEKERVAVSVGKYMERALGGFSRGLPGIPIPDIRVHERSGSIEGAKPNTNVSLIEFPIIVIRCELHIGVMCHRALSLTVRPSADA